METPIARDLTDEELEARKAAERRGDPFLVFRDGEDAQHIVVASVRAA